MRNAAILYVDVSFAESVRRNRARYNKNKRDSILTHSVPQAEMEETYCEDDWKEIAPDPSGRIRVNETDVPYTTMLNEPELTVPPLLEERYRAAIGRLWEERLRA